MQDIPYEESPWSRNRPNIMNSLNKKYINGSLKMTSHIIIYERKKNSEMRVVRVEQNVTF